MSNIPPMLPSDVSVARSDPVYMAHGYLTKVPIAAIQPYIEAFTEPGDVVLDPFAGSGMTGVAAATLDRRAKLVDVSVLGRHIGTNYVRLVNASELRRAAEAAVEATRQRLVGAYETTCGRCSSKAETSKVVWSVEVACEGCGAPVSFYRSLEEANWRKAAMKCPTCAAAITSRLPRKGERPEVETVRCDCSSKLFDQDVSDSATWSPTELVEVPSVEIGSDRQMYVASALGKHGLTSTASFFSQRNASVLAVLREEVQRCADADIAAKLMFAFTAILPRASKRYQWSKARPLNAANANYYVAPVFYEWNVYELFLRKVDAVAKSDAFIESERRRLRSEAPVDVEYINGSATSLPFADDSIDYVFTDPPFGWNIFYSDMSMFQEVWLGGDLTDAAQEAVIDRTPTQATRTKERYEDMLADSLRECLRVLKPGGWITLVFGNSSGSVWAVVQRAIKRAGLRIEPNTIATLHKGQRSVKGLASGFENVVTHDLMMSLRAASPDEAETEIIEPSRAEIEDEIRSSAVSSASASELYVRLLRDSLRRNWSLNAVDLRIVTDVLRAAGIDVEAKTGRLVHAQLSTHPT